VLWTLVLSLPSQWCSLFSLSRRVTFRPGAPWLRIRQLHYATI